MPFPEFSTRPPFDLDTMESDLKTMSVDDLRQTLRMCVYALIKLGCENDRLHAESQKTGLILAALVNRSPDRSITVEDREVEPLILKTNNGTKTRPAGSLHIEEDGELEAFIVRFLPYPKAMQ